MATKKPAAKKPIVDLDDPDVVPKLYSATVGEGAQGLLRPAA
jgi:hypothetical protein